MTVCWALFMCLIYRFDLVLVLCFSWVLCLFWNLPVCRSDPCLLLTFVFWITSHVPLPVFIIQNFTTANASCPTWVSRVSGTYKAKIPSKRIKLWIIWCDITDFLSSSLRYTLFYFFRKLAGKFYWASGTICYNSSGVFFACKTKQPLSEMLSII